MTRRQGTSHALMRERKRLRRAGGKRVCAWCGELIDMTLEPPDPGSFELDHDQPRRYGGADGLENIRVLHRRCNRQRGAGRRQPGTPHDRSDHW